MFSAIIWLIIDKVHTSTTSSNKRRKAWRCAERDHAFAVDGGEIMASVQTAMIGGLPYTALRDAIWSHPTLVEGMIPLFSSAPVASEDSGQAGDSLQHAMAK